VDESGDHELASFDPSYPVFVLLFLIVSKKDYANEICPQFLQFKMRHWGHPEVVLHEHEIRKPRDDFSFLQIPDRRECFHRDLSELMARPVGIHHLRPDQKNRAYEILEPKLRRSPQGKIAGWGLKIIP